MPRPKAFDPAAKLDEAMVLFWNEGFETTSIPKLERELKINRFSIYDTYGDKRTLFVKVLERYTGILEEQFVLPLQNGSEGLADLRRFLQDMWHKFGEPEQSSGCLLINTATEIGSHDQGIAAIVNGYFERVGDALLTCLLRARELGEIEGSDADLRDHARVILSAMQGVLVQLRLVDDAQRVTLAVKAIGNYVRRLSSN